MVFVQQSGLLNVMIYQNKKTGLISMITIFSGLLSVVLNYFFIPIFGSIFAGVSNLIVGLFLITLTFLLARRNYYIEINFPLLSFAVGFILLCVWVDYSFGNHWVALGLKIALLLGWVILGFKLNYIRPKILCQVSNEILLKFHNIAIRKDDERVDN